MLAGAQVLLNQIHFGFYRAVPASRIRGSPDIDCQYQVFGRGLERLTFFLPSPLAEQSAATFLPRKARVPLIIVLLR